MPIRCEHCGKYLSHFEIDYGGHMCNPNPKPYKSLYGRNQYAEQKAKSEEPPVEPNPNEFKHLGLSVTRNRASFAIDGTRIKILATGVEYFESCGDPSARYITFRFISGPGTTTHGRKYCITHKQFLKRATLWEEKLEAKFVSIGQLMTANGAPCEAGCRAIYWWLTGENCNRGRDWFLINITLRGQPTWNIAIETQKIYDWYMRKMGPMPVDYLVWMAKAMGIQVLGSGNHAPGSKSYALLCRQLGIKS